MAELDVSAAMYPALFYKTTILGSAWFILKSITIFGLKLSYAVLKSIAMKMITILDDNRIICTIHKPYE